jgi:hypothetical protein
VYQSDIRFIHTQFESNQSGDDGVNIIRSAVSIKHSRFMGALSDSLDLDFCTGTITHTHFQNSGNDAIDLSGSDITINTVTIKGSGDKAISAGEKTKLSLQDIHISHAYVGIASKDLSVVTGNGVVIEKSHIGIAVFQKKPEYGAAQAFLQNTTLVTNETPYIVEKNSILTINRDTKKEGTLEGLQ